MENKKCEKIKDQIADLIAEVLPGTETELLERQGRRFTLFACSALGLALIALALGAFTLLR